MAKQPVKKQEDESSTDRFSVTSDNVVFLDADQPYIPVDPYAVVDEGETEAGDRFVESGEGIKVEDK